MGLTSQHFERDRTWVRQLKGKNAADSGPVTLWPPQQQQPADQRQMLWRTSRNIRDRSVGRGTHPHRSAGTPDATA